MRTIAARIFIALFIVYVLQSTFAYMQIKRSYNIINDVKAQHRGLGYHMVTGTGRTRFLLIARGYFIILVVDDYDTIIDYYGMDGYTVFATPKHKPEYVGMTLDELQSTFKKKNQLAALKDAREQLQLLREQANAKDEVIEDDLDIDAL